VQQSTRPFRSSVASSSGRILQNRLTSVWQLMSISGMPKPAALGAHEPRWIGPMLLQSSVCSSHIEAGCGNPRPPPAVARADAGGTHPALIADGGR
jgi:hypothetical protein